MGDDRSPSAPDGLDPLLPGTPVGGDLAAVSREGARRFDAEMADAEQEAERFRLRGRSVVDALWEAMHRGDAVTVTMGGRTLTGTLGAVRNDLAVLELPEALAAVRIGAVDAVRLDPGGPGVAGDRTHGSMAAYLRMLMLDGVPVTVLARGVEIGGVIEAVTPDHVLVAGRPPSRWVVPFRSLQAVVRSRP